MGMFTDLFKGFGGGGEDPAGPAGATGMDAPQFAEVEVDMVNKEYRRRQTERQPFEAQWRLATEFLEGNQFMDINPVTNTIEEIPKLYWHQEREVFNQIATIVETRMSKMSRQKPSLKTRPASSDDGDISSAKVTSMLVASTWADQDMDIHYEDFISWLELCGTVFWKPTWNKQKGRMIFNGQQQDESGQSQGEPITLHEGDIDTVLVPSWEVFPDSSYRRGMKDCRSIIHAKAFHIDDIFDMTGVKVDAEPVDVMTLQKASSARGGIAYAYGGTRTTAAKLEDHAVLKEYYERPCNKYPQGRFIMVAGTTRIYSGPLPYMIGKDGAPELPLVRVVAIDRAGCFWGRSIIDRCIPIQRRYNALRNRIAEYLNLVAIGQWMSPVGSLEEGSELNNEPGNIAYYRPGANGEKPSQVQHESLPGDFAREEQMLLSEFTSVSGVSELSRYAEAPQGVKSGVALGITKEQDDTRISTSITRVANGVVELGKMWIRLYRQMVQEPRLMRYIGGNREADVRQWEASDLRSDDVFIENMAALAETPSQRRQMVFDLINAGLFAKPEASMYTEDARQKIFQLLEFGHWESGDEDDHFLQKSRARNENRRMVEGVPVLQIRDFDDHMIHIDVHNRQRMQAEYEDLLKTPQGAMVEQMMQAHIAQHIQAALAAMPKVPAPVPPGQNGPPPKGDAK